MDLNAKRAEAQQKAAHPLAGSWDETKTLVTILKGAADVTDTRLRICAALCRIVESMHLLIVPRKTTRLAALQINFVGGARRDYLIVSRSGRGNKTARTESKWEALTASWESGEKRRGRGVDLRTPDGVKKVTRLLESLDLNVSQE